MLRSCGVCDWPRRARLQVAACPSAHCCCGGAWARRVDGPALAALTHGGDDNPLSPCIARPMRLRWAPCRKLNWERDALAGCLRNRLVGCGSASVVVAHINCVSYITVGVECALLQDPLHLLHNKSTSLVLPSLAINLSFASRLSFTCCCRSSHSSHEDYHHTFHLHSINYTFKMKYQLIALPALAATVAAQDLYVNSSLQPISIID